MASVITGAAVVRPPLAADVLGVVPVLGMAIVIAVCSVMLVPAVVVVCHCVG